MTRDLLGALANVEAAADTLANARALALELLRQPGGADPRLLSAMVTLIGDAQLELGAVRHRLATTIALETP